MTKDKNIIVYLADLRHDYQGVLSTDTMPLGIAYMKAVMDRDLPQVESKLFAYPKKLEEAISVEKPHVLFLTNYMWNERLSLHFAKWLKSKNPSSLVVMGGPNVPIENDRKMDYLRKNASIDIYAAGEGDFYASNLVSLFIEDNLSIAKLLKRNLDSSVYIHDGGQVVVTPTLPRSRDLDDIPSPWLTGIMDPFFDGKLTPLLETNRGCPFTCSFCVQGTKWYHRVNHFSLERIQQEVDYIGKKVYELTPDQKALVIADPNFGMYDRDIEISGYLGETQRMYNWPLFIDATTGKNRSNNIIKSIEKVNGALVMYQAVQSLDENVLENIKRKNIKLETYEDIQVYVQSRGMRSNSDLILGLPGETLSSHLDSMKRLINSGTHKLNNFQSMMLMGSELETVEEREKFGFRTKYRMLPKSFGVYMDEKIFELDEIITETKTLSFDDYLTARKYHFIVSVFWNESKFELLTRSLNKIGVENWAFIEAIYSLLAENKNHGLAKLFDSFIAETKDELFNNEDELLAFYRKPDNFRRVKQSEIGDNLVYKYRAMGSFWYWREICTIAFNAAWRLISTNKNVVFNIETWKLILNEWEKYTFFKYASGQSITALIADASYEFIFDIDQWVKALESDEWWQPSFDHSTKILFQLSEEKKSNIQSAIKIWGYELRSLPMLVRRIQNDWTEREHQVLNGTLKHRKATSA